MLSTSKQWVYGVAGALIPVTLGIINLYFPHSELADAIWTLSILSIVVWFRISTMRFVLVSHFVLCLWIILTEFVSGEFRQADSLTFVPIMVVSVSVSILVAYQLRKLGVMNDEWSLEWDIEAVGETVI